MKKVISLILLVCLFMCGCKPVSSTPKNTDSHKSKYEQNNQDTSNNKPNNNNNINNTPSYSRPGPPQSEYDEIVLYDARYYLCKKIDSGFSSNAVYYGIYDNNTKHWAMEYTQLSSTDHEDTSYLKFSNHGNGVFSYTYSSFYRSAIFLSADLGGTFKISDPVYNRNDIHFDDGKALVILGKEAAFVGSTLTSDNYIVQIDTRGNINEFRLSEFDPDVELYWGDFLPSNNSGQIFVEGFHTYINNKKVYYIFAYFYDADKYIIIDDQSYATRMGASNVSALLYDGKLRICNLRGDDGKYYFVEFDRNGNVVTEATSMDDIF